MLTGNGGDLATDLERLLAATARRDRQAFRALYEATSAKLYGIVLRICRDPGLAQDVLQEAFLKVWTRAQSYSASEGRPVTWLASVARNTAIDAIRRRSDLALGMDSEGRALIDAFEQSATDADPFEAQALRVCLEGLDAEQRDCVTLAYCVGYSREELAQRFERPVGTIKTWLHRGLAKLKTCLDGS